MIPPDLSLLGPFLIGILICVVCGCQESNQIDCQIVGHSMATAFKSEHSVATCDQCGFEFTCDVVGKSKAGQGRVICGNCGCQVGPKPTARHADQVKLNRGQPVHRWDVVAFRRGDRVLVKRVIGLPGETVDVSEGNLLIDGEIAAKPQRLWNQTSSVVFDSRPSQSRANTIQLFERLVPRAKEAWAMSGTTIAHHSRQANHGNRRDAEFDFLDYRHRRCYKTSKDPKTPAAIDDAHPFNQSIRRTPHRVDELDVRVEVLCADKGSIQLERMTPKGTISARIDLHDDQTIALRLTRRGGGDIKTAESKGIKVSGKSVEVRLVNYDDLIRLFVDGMEYLEAMRFESIESPEPLDVDVSQPVVSIGVSREDSVTIKRVSIWRDWHLYQGEPKPSVKLPLDTGKDGYYVVGDNLPVSEDSRHFGLVHDIIGVVKSVDDN